jgi:hypothetical protein
MSISVQIPTDATSANAFSNLAEDLSEAFEDVFRTFQDQGSADSDLNRSTSSQTSESTTALTATSTETVASTLVEAANKITITDTASSDEAKPEVPIFITLPTTFVPQVLEGPELVTNGGFEDHGDLNRSTWGTFETISGWTATEGNIEIQEGSHGGTPDVASDQGFLEVDSHGGKDTNSTVETSVTVEEAGLHKLTFDYSPRGENGADAAETSQVNVLVNGKIVDTISSETIGFEKQEYTLSLPAGENTIAFQAVGSDDSYGGLIDNVSLKLAPRAAPQDNCGELKLDVNIDVDISYAGSGATAAELESLNALELQVQDTIDQAWELISAKISLSGENLADLEGENAQAPQIS